MKNIKDLSKKVALGLTLATGVAASSNDSNYNKETTIAAEVIVFAIVALAYGCIKSLRAENNLHRFFSDVNINGQVGIINSRYINDNRSEITIVVDENYETKTNISDITCVNEFEKDITEMEI